MYVAGDNSYNHLYISEIDNEAVEEDQIVVPPSITQFDVDNLLSFSTYSDHSVYVCKDGTAYGIGSNQNYRFDTSQSPTIYSTPTKITFLDSINRQSYSPMIFISAVCGDLYTMYLVASSDNQTKLYITGQPNSQNPIPICFEAFKPAAIFGGKDAAAYISNEGKLYMINVSDDCKPAKIGNFNDVVQVAFCDSFAIAITKSNRAFLIQNRKTRRLKIPNYPILQISGTTSHVMFLLQPPETEESLLFGFGRTEHYELGISDPSTGFHVLAEGFSYFTDENQTIKQISCGGRHSLFLTSENRVYACGTDDRGQFCMNKCTGKENAHRRCPLKNIVENPPVYIIASKSSTIIFTGTSSESIPINMPNRSILENTITYIDIPSSNYAPFNSKRKHRNANESVPIHAKHSSDDDVDVNNGKVHKQNTIFARNNSSDSDFDENSDDVDDKNTIFARNNSNDDDVDENSDDVDDKNAIVARNNSSDDDVDENSDDEKEMAHINPLNKSQRTNLRQISETSQVNPQPQQNLDTQPNQPQGKKLRKLTKKIKDSVKPEPIIANESVPSYTKNLSDDDVDDKNTIYARNNSRDDGVHVSNGNVHKQNNIFARDNSSDDDVDGNSKEVDDKNTIFARNNSRDSDVDDNNGKVHKQNTMVARNNSNDDENSDDEKEMANTYPPNKSQTTNLPQIQETSQVNPQPQQNLDTQPNEPQPKKLRKLKKKTTDLSSSTTLPANPPKTAIIYHPKMSVTDFVLLSDGPFTSTYKVRTSADYEFYSLKLFKKYSIDNFEKFLEYSSQCSPNTRNVLPIVYHHFEKETTQFNFLNSIQHSRVLPSYIDEQEKIKVPYVCRKFVQFTLENVIERHNIKNTDKIKIIKRLLNIIKNIHEKGFSHGNIKPSNILLDNDYTVYLTDFGEVDSIQSRAQLIANNNNESLKFMAPELFKVPHANNIDKLACDIYSVGKVIYYIASKNKYFEKQPSQISLFDQTLTKASFPESLFTKNGKNMIMKCCQTDPKNRCKITDVINYMEKPLFLQP